MSACDTSLYYYFSRAEAPVPTTTDETGGATARAPRDTARFFDDIAGLLQRFSQSLDTPELPVNRWLAEHLESGRCALDVGCGSGRCTVMLADRYDEVVGVDVAPAMIEFAKRDRSRPNVRYQIRDVMSLTPERDELFDLVLVFSCVVHAGPPDLVLNHLRCLVAPGGMLLLVEIMWQPGWGSRDWQADFAFRVARSVWETVGDLDDVTAVLQAMLTPTLREISEVTSIPPTREEFLREYWAALPGATIEEKDLSGQKVAMILWRAEDERSRAVPAS
jgi:2-polyprenyl-3-methyl-5-hydroxy-6-metoxy-1,4-benzoquinol methylase